MFKKGNIVYHDNIVFSDGCVDTKKNRPCVVLFEVGVNNNDYVCTVPLTSRIKSLNKHPYKYQFVSDVVYDYKKFSFVKLDDVRLYNIGETHDTNINLSEEMSDRIIDRIKNYDNSNLKFIKEYLEYIELFDKIEEKEKSKQKRIERKNKRQNLKRITV